MVLEEPGSLRVVLERTGVGWRVSEPSNADVDPDRAEQVAGFLAQLRVDAWLPVTESQGGFLGGTRIVVATSAGRTTIEFGGSVPDRAAGQEAYYVRNARTPGQVGAVPARVVGQLKSVWGR